MLSKFQKDGSAETLALEVIGITTGIDKLNGEATPNLRGNAHARDISKAIDTALERDGRSMDPLFAQLLREAKPYFMTLASMPSATKTDVLDFKTKRARQLENPRFEAKLEEMRSNIGPIAQALFDERFVHDARTALEGTEGTALHGPNRDGDAIRLAISMGRV